MSTPLAREIAATIRETGPIGVDRYMALCLGHPLHGYYRTRDPLGAGGDFTTAPEISQMFGELIGVWIAAVHALMGAPEALPAREALRLVELGPGRGTLMADALRALRRVAPGARIELHLVETSPALRAVQERRFAGATWHAEPGTVPQGPAVWIANEFFDCLPVRQFQRTARGWCERVVGLNPDGALAFGLAPEPTAAIAASAPDGALMTLPGAGLDLTRALARRLVRQGGALLAIDYGYAQPGFGDTFQAVARHRFVDPLESPGEADLTAHVDFSAMALAARGEGAAVHGPVAQRDFLLALGLGTRAERLAAAAGAAQAAEIGRAFARLTDPGRRGMGRLFKAVALAGPDLPPLPGFPAP